MIEAAGGEPVLAAAGEASRRVSWSDIAGAAPDVVAFMPCGYPFERAVSEGRGLLEIAELAGVPRIVAVDGDSMFSRPGPRVVDGVEALAWALHPDAVPAPRPGAIHHLR
jgi:iron complex transport system substrate-binding protein